MPSKRAFIFAGGGTGGHLYPGIAIAEQLRSLDPSAHILFICSDKPLDKRLLDTEREESLPIPARPWSLRPGALFRLFRSWGPAVRAARRAIRDARAAGRDVHVIAMGGYVAAPVAQAARVERAPLTLVNLDAAPGKANRWISRHARSHFTAADAPAVPTRWVRVPPIVRRAAVAARDPADCRRRLALDPARPTLLITGASQGAGSINAMMLALLARDPAFLRSWQVYHQSGDARAGLGPDELRAAYKRASIPAIVVPFCDDMAAAWGAADLAVSRAGAGSVAEVWANATPTLFLPYPYHRDQHQRRNAAPLADSGGGGGGAVIETDRIDPEANASHAGEILRALVSDPARRDRMRDALRALGPADGARRIAEALLRPTV